MDDLTLMKSFRAERAEEDAKARAEVWRALEDRFESASATPVAPAAPAPAAIRVRRRRRHLLRHRRLVAFAGATAVAAAIAGILVLGSGPTAQPAAAEILHKTAAAAVSAGGPTASVVPGPGQFRYTKFKRLELEGWLPSCDPLGDRPCMMMGGTMSGADAFNALMPMTQAEWLGEDGVGRLRQVAGTPRLLTEEEQGRWEAAGSPSARRFDVGTELGCHAGLVPGIHVLLLVAMKAEGVDGRDEPAMTAEAFWQKAKMHDFELEHEHEAICPRPIAPRSRRSIWEQEDARAANPSVSTSAARPRISCSRA